MRFDYTGNRDECLDPSLRHAFEALPDLRDVWIEWSPSSRSISTTSKKANIKTTRDPDQPEPLSNVEMINLNISDMSGGISNPVGSKLGPQPTITYHLGQLVSIFRSASAECLNIRLHFGNDDHSVRDAMKFMAANLKDLKFPNLKTLGITVFFAVKNKEEVAGGWVSQI